MVLSVKQGAARLSVSFMPKNCLMWKNVQSLKPNYKEIARSKLSVQHYEYTEQHFDFWLFFLTNCKALCWCPLVTAILQNLLLNCIICKSSLHGRTMTLPAFSWKMLMPPYNTMLFKLNASIWYVQCSK